MIADPSCREAEAGCARPSALSLAQLRRQRRCPGTRGRPCHDQRCSRANGQPAHTRGDDGALPPGLGDGAKKELYQSVETVVNTPFGRLTGKIATVEATTVRNTRQLVEVR